MDEKIVQGSKGERVSRGGCANCRIGGRGDDEDDYGSNVARGRGLRWLVTEAKTRTEQYLIEQHCLLQRVYSQYSLPFRRDVTPLEKYAYKREKKKGDVDPPRMHSAHTVCCPIVWNA